MSNDQMRGKICMVTGATLGIGRATAEKLAALGATVIIVGRSAERCQNTVDEIKAKTGNTAVDMFVADLSSQASIRQLAKDYKARYQKLHVLVNNAGSVFMSRQLTVDGLEMTFALNHLGYFLLTNLLLDVIKASAPARIINVSSQAQSSGHINFDDLQGKQRYAGFRAYSQSKLANIVFTYELAKRLQGTGVTVNALHPGTIASGFGKNNGPLMGVAMRIAGLFMPKPDKGAETSVYLASSPEVEDVTGKYFANKHEKRSISESYDEGVQRRLWEVSAALTKL